MKIDLFSKKLAHVLLGLLSTSILLTACGANHNSNSNAETYKYRNPDKGNEVELKEASTVNRLSQSKKETAESKKAVRLYDGFLKVDVKSGQVTFRFKKDSPQGNTVKTIEILLQGRLPKPEMKGWIDDAEAEKLGGSRAYAYVSCFPDSKGNVCATSYVSVRYADENGDEKEKQFHASPRDAEIKRRKEKERTQATKTSGTTASTSKQNDKQYVIVPSSSDSKTSLPTIVINPKKANTDQSAGNNTTTFQPDDTANSEIEDNSVVTQIDEKEYSIIDEKPEEVPPPIKSKAKTAQQARSKSPVKALPKDSPAFTSEEDEEDIEGDSHEDDDDDTGMYVTPQTPEKLQDKLIGKAKTPKKPAPSSPQVTGSNPQSTLGVPLNLASGGLSRFEPNRGSIINGSLMPKSGAGFIRKSPDAKAYGGGFLISFIEESSRRFTMANPQCGTINVNQIALQKGGRFKGHASHQNGTDADLSYFGTPWAQMVKYYKTTVEVKKTKKRKTVYRSSISENFNYDCFLKYLKFMDDQKFANTGDSRFEGNDIVDLVFVNAGVKAGVCAYIKNNKLESTYGDAANLMYPEDGHDHHFHLRVRCSPKHIECKPKDLDRVQPFRKRGCHF